MDNDGDATVDEPNETYPEVLTKQTISASTLRYPYVRVEYKTQGGQLVQPVRTRSAGRPSTRFRKDCR